MFLPLRELGGFCQPGQKLQEISVEVQDDADKDAVESHLSSDVCVPQMEGN